ncbi:McrC family protein, partial [Escherichia coli]|nr:McrC family protein [Escherichia coli]
PPYAGTSSFWTGRRWRGLLALARLLLADQYQQTTSGKAGGHALLFEMNVLFEEYIGRLLQRALAPSGLRVRLQGGLRHCLHDGE